MKTIEVVAAIITKNDKILITKRKKGEFENLWEFPGGKVESGETREEAIIREIKEELEVDINVDQYLATIEHDYEEFHLTMHNYFCTIKNGTMKLNDHKDAKWMNIEDLTDINWVPADIKVVAEIISYKKNS